MPVRDQAIRLDPSAAEVRPRRAISRCCTRCTGGGDEFDVIHFHVDMIHFPFFAGRRRTHRDDAARPARPEGPGRGLSRAGRSFPWSRSRDDQRRPLPDANWVATVPSRARRRRVYRFTAEPEGGYLAFLGRISPEKRPDRAIEIASRSGMPLKIAAKVDTADRAYFHEVIEPLLARSAGRVRRRDRRRREVRLPGQRRGAAVPDRLAGAVRPGDDRGHGLRHAGRSPGGCGSVPEVVEHGVTGFIVDERWTRRWRRSAGCRRSIARGPAQLSSGASRPR